MKFPFVSLCSVEATFVLAWVKAVNSSSLWCSSTFCWIKDAGLWYKCFASIYLGSSSKSSKLTDGLKVGADFYDTPGIFLDLDRELSILAPSRAGIGDVVLILN